MIYCTWSGWIPYLAGDPWELRCGNAVHRYEGIFYVQAIKNSTPEEFAMLYNRVANIKYMKIKPKIGDSLLAWPFVKPFVGMKVIKAGRYYYLSVRGVGNTEGYYLKERDFPTVAEAARRITGIHITKEMVDIMGGTLYLKRSLENDPATVAELEQHIESLLALSERLSPPLAVRLWDAVQVMNDVKDLIPPSEAILGS